LGIVPANKISSVNLANPFDVLYVGVAAFSGVGPSRVATFPCRLRDLHQVPFIPEQRRQINHGFQCWQGKPYWIFRSQRKYRR
jgi:hypothetical protein